MIKNIRTPKFLQVLSKHTDQNGLCAFFYHKWTAISTWLFVRQKSCSTYNLRDSYAESVKKNWKWQNQRWIFKQGWNSNTFYCSNSNVDYQPGLFINGHSILNKWIPIHCMADNKFSHCSISIKDLFSWTSFQGWQPNYIFTASMPSIPSPASTRLGLWQMNSVLNKLITESYESLINVMPRKSSIHCSISTK